MQFKRPALLFCASILSTAALTACTGAGDAVGESSAAATSAGAPSGSLAAGTSLLTTANVNFRSAPAIQNNIIDVIPDGTVVSALGGDLQNGFYAVSYEGKGGFVSAKYLALAPVSPTQDAGTAEGDGDAGSSPTDDSGPSSTDAAPSSPFSVAYIGDSHSDYYGNARGAFGFLGQHLVELMAADGIPLSLFAASGSIPSWWEDGTAQQAATWGYTQTAATPAQTTCQRSGKSGACVPKLSAILSTPPSLFVIEQGTNLFGYSNSFVIQQIQSILGQIAGKTGACLWVAAPNAATNVVSQADQDNLHSLIAQYAAPTCYVYDSRFLPETDTSGSPVLDAQGHLIMDVPLPYSPDANNDGEHFGMTAAGKWALGVAIMIQYIQGKTH